jgi:predicted metalloprotease
MRWREQRESSNIEDRRGVSGRGIAIGGGGLGMVIIVLLAILCGADPRKLLEQLPADQGQPAPQRQGAPPQNDDTRKFVGSVLGSTEDAWSDLLRREGKQYREPTLVLFTDAVQSACGRAGASSGPFYCPGDEKLYLDTAFFRELNDEFGAPGDFAQAYVIAHEVGHHVQNLLGTMDQVSRAQQRGGEAQGNQLSVNLELQADCYAGIWAKYAESKGLVETGDVDEALKAAASVGDDNIQRKSQGYVVPESFTHGSAQDRATWFNRGFQSGDLRQCNTFGSR